MMKYLIIGGSGFIGTNLIFNLLKCSNVKVMNIDYHKPNLIEHSLFWINVDIRDREQLKQIVIGFQPDIVIHLAARTDLTGKKLDDYSANIQGVKNLLEALDEVHNLKRAIFTSSMYVCYPGYNPKNFEDYAPHTLYGESKVLTEKIIKGYNPQKYDWCIIRPTSIWGPYFGEPYADFFHIVMSRKYFHMGSKACSKTYGYIDNTIFQIISLIEATPEKINKKVFYLGDWPAYNISEWANEIAENIGFKILRIPFFLFRFAGWGGDLLKLIGIKFPMTSFRLKNMTTNNIQNLSPIQEIAPNLPVTREKGIKITIDWIKSKQKK